MNRKTISVMNGDIITEIKPHPNSNPNLRKFNVVNLAVDDRGGRIDVNLNSAQLIDLIKDLQFKLSTL